MKNFTLVLLLTLTTQFASAQTSQPSQPINLTLKMDPVTHCQIRYHYFPNLEAYYDNVKSVYIYNNKGQWVVAAEIPAGYRGYSLYNKMKVPITDYDDDNVVQFIKQHKVQFPYNSGRKTKEMTASVN
jgi:hypothetical protein